MIKKYISSITKIIFVNNEKYQVLTKYIASKDIPLENKQKLKYRFAKDHLYKSISQSYIWPLNSDILFVNIDKSLTIPYKKKNIITHENKKVKFSFFVLNNENNIKIITTELIEKIWRK